MRRTRNAAPAAASKNGIYTHDKNTPFRHKIKLSYPLAQRKVIFIEASQDDGQEIGENMNIYRNADIRNRYKRL